MTSIFSLPFLIVFVYLFLLSAAPCLSQTAAINDLENQLFFRQYDDEKDVARLSRIENYIFGQTYSDSIENRIARIKTAVPAAQKASSLAPANPAPSDNVPPVGAGAAAVRHMDMPSGLAAETKTYVSPPSSTIQSHNDDNDDAQTRQLKVMEARASQVNELLSRAVALYRQKQFKEAIDLFEQVIRLDPQNASAHFSLGIALEANGNLTQAAAEYANALAIDADNKDYKLAVQNIKSKIDEENKSKIEDYKWQLLASQAADALKNEQFDHALVMYNHLVEKDPHQALYQYNLGTVYLMVKKPDDALVHYKLAHKLDPADHIYDQSLQKLQQSMKEAKQTNESKRAKDAWGQTKENTPKKINLQTVFGLDLKSSHNGVMVKKVTLGSRAAQVGLYPLDIIKAVDEGPINKVSDLEQVLSSKPIGQRFQMIIVRGGITAQLLF